MNDLLSRLGLADPPAAVLWDMDGTIVATESRWGSLSEEVVASAGGLWYAEDTRFVVGASTIDHANRLADAVVRGGGRRPEPMEIFGRLTDLMAARVYPNVALLPGAGELLEAFREAGIPQVLVTATPRPLVEIALAALGETYFNVLVTGSDDVPGKPDPAPFFLGAKRVAAEVAECLIFEDSRAGLAAARATGAACVDVKATPLAELAALL